MSATEDPKVCAGSIAMRLDAQEAFENIQADIDHFAGHDPDIAWVQEALRARLSEIPEEDVSRIGALLWPGLKAMLQPSLCPPWWPETPLAREDEPTGLSWFGVPTDSSVPRPVIALRHGLVEGNWLRRRIEQDLAGPLAADALLKTAQQVKEWQRSSDSARTREFDQAHDEVKRTIAEMRSAGPERYAIAAAVAVTAIIVYMVAMHASAKYK